MKKTVLATLPKPMARKAPGGRRHPWRWAGPGLLLCGLLASAPQPGRAQPATVQQGEEARLPATGQARFFALLHRGDSVYAQKAGYQSFGQALIYYDQAQALADASQDTLLLAEAVFARARVYDAWNKEPQKTILYFQQAAALFGRLPGQQHRALYARQLVAHAYEKAPDIPAPCRPCASYAASWPPPPTRCYPTCPLW